MLTTEFVIAGLLPSMARDLHVTVSKAGLLVTIFALTVAAVGPILTARVVGFERKKLFLFTLLLFALSNELAAFAPNIVVMAVARLLPALMLPVFWSLASETAVQITGPEHAGKAIPMMSFGVVGATIFGIPIGALIAYQFGWRCAFAILGVLALAKALLLLFFLPRIPGAKDRVPVLQQLGILRQPRILGHIFLSLLVFAGMFTAYTGSVATLQEWSDKLADMVLAPSAAGLFKWRQFEPEMILLAVGWYLRFSLSYRDVEELLAERGLHADHVTVWRWVQRYGPEIQRRLRPRLRPTNDSWRVDETYIRVKGKWVYLYRAVDSSGATIDFLLSAKRDTATAQRFLTKALGGENHPHPRVINTDKYAAYPPAIVQLKDEGVLEENCQHRLVQYLNNVLEQDHRAIKRRVRASQHFRSFWGAWRTIAGYEAIHMIRKGQACCSGAGAEVGLLHRFILGLFAATN